MGGTSDDPGRSPGRAIASSPWIVVFAGVVVMVVLLVVALSTYRGRSPGPGSARPANAGAPLPTPRWPSAATTADATAGTTAPSSAGAPSSSTPSPSPSVRSSSPSAPSPSRTASPAGASAEAPEGAPSPRISAPPPAPPAVTGRYGVDREFTGGFIGAVKVSNTSRTGQDWEVRLAFSGGRLSTAWVANAQQGTLRQSDGGYTYRSGERLASGTSVVLQFHVEGDSTTPTVCTVNGGGCSGL
ncbi:cellulose binding domain-containing protein [Micromonospora sp. URMC 103]|uniref:cellulose binding domain-containing protein n=1 Tax=Micromonospora sp. URMC 103 TaxID=3423406 RepID=UPI003F1D0045